MYRLERDQFLHFPYVPYWTVLGFQAGFINAFGFLNSERFVSHVTGIGTQLGLAIASSKILFALELFGFPLSFILGSFLSSLFTSVKIEQGTKPQYEIIILLMPLILFTLMILSEIGLFGDFSDQKMRQSDFILLFLLAFTCGMQNGCFATLTKGQIRTTHLTGITTDLGTDLARQWFGRLTPMEHFLTKNTNFVRILTFLAFTLGSIISVLICQRIGFLGLLVPSLTSLIVFLGFKKIQSDINLKVGPFKEKILEAI